MKRKKTKLVPPNICQKAICISSDKILSAEISSRFNKSGEYFCVIESPRMLRDDAINEIIRRNNIIATFKYDKIILAGLCAKSEAALQDYFPSDTLVFIRNSQEIEIALHGIINAEGFKGNIVCNDKEIPYGLLLAKRLKCILTVSQNVPSIITRYNTEYPIAKHLVIIDDDNEVAPVVSANYAFAIGAGIKMVAPVSNECRNVFYNDLIERAISRNSQRAQIADQRSLNQISEIKNTIGIPRVDMVTFITKGFPYGYIFPDTPSTHLFSYPDLGLCIFWNIIHSAQIKATRSALVIDPGFFEDSEVRTVVSSLKKRNIPGKTLAGDDATIYLVHHNIEYFPYDLLYICSHAGRLSGQRYKIRCYDTDGNSHLFVFNNIVGIAPPPGPIKMDTKIQFTEFREPVEFDGKAWKVSDVDAYSWAFKSSVGGGFLRQFMATAPSDWEIVEAEDGVQANHCYGIQVKDGNYGFHLHLIADHNHPIVINNGCESFYQVCLTCIFAGARSYIGSLFPVDNDPAKRIGELLFSPEYFGKSLPLSLWKIQKEVFKKEDDRCYVHFGCHFTSIKSSDTEMGQYIPYRLLQALKNWKHTFDSSDVSLEKKENIRAIIDFLEKELRMICVR